MNNEELNRVLLEIHDDYKFTFSLISSSFETNQIDGSNYYRLVGMLLETDNDDLDKLLIINSGLIEALKDHKRQKISERLVIGAEKIEATEDPKEKARLMIHYNNLLKELGA